MTETVISVAMLGILMALYVVDSILVRKKFKEFEDLHHSHIQAIGCILKVLSGECKIEGITIDIKKEKAKAKTKTKKKDKVAKKEKGAK